MKVMTKFCPPLILLIVAFFISAKPAYADYHSQSVALKYQNVLASFSTKFNKNDEARAHNIKLASIAIDRHEIPPGETFSFNEIVGYAGPKKGYRQSLILINGNEAMAYGGGICQVSSTLYNAAMQAGLEIIERHPHSKEVKYVEKGKDAATSYGSIDLKFKNIYNFPVVINTYISDNIFTTEILS